MIITDQVGNKVEIKFPPQRIISLVPSQTELLFDLGLSQQVVGLTRYCIHPAGSVEEKIKIGGTKRFNFEKIKALQPDLIIANKEENYKEGIELLLQHYPVWISDIYNLNDALAMMRQVAQITGTEHAGNEIATQIETGFNNYRPLTFTGQPATAAYFIWRKPYMVAAANTFIDNMLQVFGVKNAFGHLERYPEVTGEMLAEAKPAYIFLSTEPYSFSEKHLAEFEVLSPTSKVVLVDGEMFSWYGSRLMLAPAYFAQLSALLL